MKTFTQFLTEADSYKDGFMHYYVVLTKPKMAMKHKGVMPPNLQKLHDKFNHSDDPAPSLATVTKASKFGYDFGFMNKELAKKFQDSVPKAWKTEFMTRDAYLMRERDRVKAKLGHF